MSDMQKILSEIRSRRALCRDNNVAPGTANEDAIYRICEEIVSEAMLSAAPALTPAEKAGVGDGDDLVEQMRPHIEKLRGCVAINEAMGRVVEGQADAIRSLTAIFDALAAQGDDAQEERNDG